MWVHRIMGKFRLEGPSWVSAPSRISSEVRPSYTGFVQPGQRRQTAAHLGNLLSLPNSRDILLVSQVWFFITESAPFEGNLRDLCSPTSYSKHMSSFQGDRALHDIYIISYEPWYHKGKRIFSFVTDMEKSSLLSHIFILWKLLI